MIIDVGLFAAVQGGVRGVRVFVSGGLGSTAEIAHLWREFVPERAVLAACEAVVSVFFRDGERKNRKKNRLKFLLRKLGEAELLRRLDVEMTRLLAEEARRALAGALDRYVHEFHEAPPPPAGGEATAIGDKVFARWRRTNTLAQRQAGYHAVTVKLPLGDITVAQLHAVAEASRRFGNGEARATNTQNFVLRWVPEGRLLGLYRALEAAGLAEADADHITDIGLVPGRRLHCSLAITRSMKLGADIRDHLVAGGAAAEEVVEAVGPFAIKISGCPNSCGQHHIGDVGLTGLMVKGADGVERPHYSIRVGGGVGPNARIGDRLDGRVPEEEAPRVIAALARHYVAERGEGETFREFAVRIGTAELKRVGLSAANGVI